MSADHIIDVSCQAAAGEGLAKLEGVWIPLADHYGDGVGPAGWITAIALPSRLALQENKIRRQIGRQLGGHWSWPSSSPVAASTAGPERLGEGSDGIII